MQPGWWLLMLALPIGLVIGGFRYSDFQQYWLTLAFMAPSALLSYVLLYWLARLFVREFRVRFAAHALLLADVCVLAPIVATWFIERPIDLMDGAGQTLLIAAGCSLFVIGIAQQIVEREVEATMSKPRGPRTTIWVKTSGRDVLEQTIWGLPFGSPSIGAKVHDPALGELVCTGVALNGSAPGSEVSEVRFRRRARQT